MTIENRLLGFLSLTLLLLASSVSFAARNELPEVSPEGLKLIKGTKLGAVYMKEGADFSGYDKVAILDCYVAFKKNWQRDKNRERFGSVSDHDVVRIKSELADEFKKVFSEELAKKGEEVVTTAASDVLILRPAIINLDITAPDTLAAGRSFTVAASAGQMTLFLELYDSVTSELLARVMDPEAIDGMGFYQVQNRVTNRMEADRLFKKWSDILGDFLVHARSTGESTPPE